MAGLKSRPPSVCQLTHIGRIGQRAHCGFLAVQIIAPKSISA
jgi:hypothetical protein